MSKRKVASRPQIEIRQNELILRIDGSSESVRLEELQAIVARNSYDFLGNIIELELISANSAIVIREGDIGFGDAQNYLNDIFSFDSDFYALLDNTSDPNERVILFQRNKTL